ncbi:MAG TPA: Trm112 family protein [Clostridia bacterium]|nr:Trm112 family protein [Clostridia bacterium]
MLPKDLLDVLACPVCKTPLAMKGDDALKCSNCLRVYPIRDGIPVLLEQESTIEK